MERGRLSEFFPSVPIMAALMGKAPPSDAAASGSSPGFIGGLAMVHSDYSICPS